VRVWVLGGIPVDFLGGLGILWRIWWFSRERVCFGSTQFFPKKLRTKTCLFVLKLWRNTQNFEILKKKKKKIFGCGLSDKIL
jgi:hypothetical protein